MFGLSEGKHSQNNFSITIFCNEKDVFQNKKDGFDTVQHTFSCNGHKTERSY